MKALPGSAVILPATGQRPAVVHAGWNPALPGGRPIRSSRQPPSPRGRGASHLASLTLRHPTARPRRTRLLFTSESAPPRSRGDRAAWATCRTSSSCHPPPYGATKPRAGTNVFYANLSSAPISGATAPRPKRGETESSFHPPPCTERPHPLARSPSSKWTFHPPPFTRRPHQACHSLLST